MRFQLSLSDSSNVYGPGQALSNPYTGVAAIFASRLLNRRPPIFFGDGEQSRDFIYVADIVDAIVSALEAESAPGHAINVGTGRATTVNGIADALARGLGSKAQPERLDRYRAGDIRHCFADRTKARELLGFEAQTSLDDGMQRLIKSLEGQAAIDRVDVATDELTSRGLAR